MSEAVVGQRWVSHNEANLGLGMIQSVEGRRVELYFPAVNESRHYALDNAPISRITYDVGDPISDMDDVQYQIVEVIEQNGLMIYCCEDAEGQEHKLSELHLNSFVQFNSPDKRLLNGQLDNEASYLLRYETFQQLDLLRQSPVSGLLGARVELLPHQLYIAHEVAQRVAPRVLLADEVGLGKTIEAGMILHHQLHTGQASRVMILVPDSLVHQWLVEMLRRFNLRFALYDESRFAALTESPDIDLDTGEVVNPFEMEQLVICSLDGVLKHSDMQRQLAESNWDLVVVDEAHHLHWSEVNSGEKSEPVVEVDDIDSASTNSETTGQDYRLVEQLSRQTKGLLLLTATPEQAGLESHFARLRLLDPDRFHNFEEFKKEAAEQQKWQPAIESLISADDLPKEELLPLLQGDAELEKLVKDDDEALVSELTRETLLNMLIDQHGTGRVLFRNTRAAMTNFPKRQLHTYSLNCPEIYQPDDDEPMNVGNSGLTPEIHLAPEVWLKRDPRIEWLESIFEQLKGEKILLIAHHRDTALNLQQYFARKFALRSACFHEGMSIFERDRAAAYFAEREEGADVLFCSEIGSEGRNFQFAHHLVFFDIPNNPDLVEQRIGRLDRIGQTQTINLHVPFLNGSSQEVLFRFYNEGLGLFEKSFSAGFAVYQNFEEQLLHYMHHLNELSDAFIGEVKSNVQELRSDMEKGRDRLLELNSCRQPQANLIVEQVAEQEQANSLADFFERLLEEFGVEQEEHSSLSWVIRPSDHMKHSYFPGLKEDGNTVTLDRMKALSRDDIEFLTWEHPMVVEAMEMLIDSDSGNATVGTISVNGLKPGTLLLEALYTLESIAPKHLQIHRYLSQAPIRVLVDANGKDLSQAVKHEALNQLSQPLKRKIARQVLQQVKPQTEQLVQHAQQKAQLKVPEIKQSATQRVDKLLGGELKRLQQLKSKNPNIRESEIESIENFIQQVLVHVEKSSLQLQGLRLMVAS
ncbi:MAG: RNA polymerase-associated protein RapA [Gammaproteobacteria bacterium]|nr:RNA polymerase-associated protein RapA [Gammaproteobacteria bacterium]